MMEDFIKDMAEQLNEIRRKAYEAGYEKGKEDARKEFEEQQANYQEDAMEK